MLLRLLLTCVCLYFGGSMAWASDASSAAEPPAVIEYEKAYAEWKKTSLRIQELESLYQSSNEEKRPKIRAEISTAVDDSNAALVRMIPALQAAYAAKPKDKALTDLMANIARLAFEGDRFEISCPLAMRLADDFDDQPLMQYLAGLACYETGNLQDAKQYLGRAVELGLAPKNGRIAERLLNSLPERQSIIDAERARRIKEAKLNNLPRVKLTTTRGDVIVELFEDDAPNTVASFLGLVEDGFYDGLDFYRVVSGFGAMTGSPNNDTTGGPGFETLQEEGGKRPHLQGTLSMIPLTDRTNGSQFFITLSAIGAERLDGKQTVFGRVIEGMDVVERLHRVEPNARRGIVDPDRILEATVLRKRNHKYAGYSTGDIGQEKYVEGLKLFQQGKWAESANAFREALKYLPDHHSLHFNLAAALMNQRDFSEAETHLRDTIRLNSRHVNAHYFLGLLLAMNQRKQEAQQQLEEALRLSPNHQKSRELLKKLQLQ